MSTKKANRSNETKRQLLIIVGLLAATYLFATWAIDSGSIFGYILSFTGLYYAVHLTKQFIKSQFFNNDKKPKAKPAKKATKRK
ncbi:MAG: cytochrome bd-type quinol oxidase subunit 1 [Candidatus Saccharimonadales bacterium]|jgi:cytochrome bd-type quinol oxidase subunit 1